MFLKSIGKHEMNSPELLFPSRRNNTKTEYVVLHYVVLEFLRITGIYTREEKARTQISFVDSFFNLDDLLHFKRR